MRKPSERIAALLRDHSDCVVGACEELRALLDELLEEDQRFTALEDRVTEVESFIEGERTTRLEASRRG